ncbi:acyltransferase [Proteobacteria bacterium 005FR1]|nr:acyltransferase [Proteobacteria bacterium 005FR1]
MAGALVALVLPWLRPGDRSAGLASAAGLSVLLTTGLVIPNSFDYPGYIAALPVAAAALLLVSGSVERKPLPTRLLSNRYLVALGGISFTIYLWHWPILVYTQHSLATTDLSLLQGLAIIAAAVILAALTTAVLENPSRRFKPAKLWPSYALGALFFTAVALPGFGARERVLSIYDRIENSTQAPFSGEMIDIQSSAAGVRFEQFVTVGSDKSFPILYCLEDSRACESGDAESDRIVALVGGSHAAQWEPLFAMLGERYGFKLVTMVQMSCALGYQWHMDQACRRYNERIVERLRELNPIFVITNSTRLERSLESPQVESVPESYAAQWRRITSLGFPVLGIRDNPWFGDDPNLCVWNRRHAADQCARPVRELYLPEDPSLVFEGAIQSFHRADFGSIYCTRDRCPAVFQDRLMYFDTHHLTRSYVIYMANRLEHLLRAQVPEFFAVIEWNGRKMPGEGDNSTLWRLGTTTEVE